MNSNQEQDYDDPYNRVDDLSMIPTVSPGRPEGLLPEYAEFYDAAIEAGFEEWPLGGPWGVQAHISLGFDPKTGQLYHTGERRDGDRSCVLVKDDISIWLIDRDHPTLGGRSDTWRETYTHGWFNHGTKAFATNVPKEFDLDQIELIRRTCMGCGEQSGDLSRVGFAGHYCTSCRPWAKDTYEKPGWYN